MINPLLPRTRGHWTAWFGAFILAFSANLFGATATLANTDVTTQGSWKGAYGAEGFLIPNQGGTAPSYASVSFAGSSQWVWNYNSTELRALQKTGATDRLASCWYGTTGFTINLNFNDNLTHRIAVYCMDWDNGGRQQTLTLTDTATGAILNSQTISSFSQGVWLVWDIQGNTALTVKPAVGNAIINGLFFGAPNGATPPPPGPVATPAITPPGGSFANTVSFTITTPTQGAAIHYTLDGTVPTTSSGLVTGPLTLSASAAVKAKAFAAGLAESAVTSAIFTKVILATPPAAPSALAANGVTSSQINLSWADNSSDETGFRIYKKIGTAGAYTGLPTTGANATTFVVTGLSAATQHFFKVAAVNSAGESAFSTEISVTTPAGQIPAPGTSVSFVKQDTGTQGNWMGNYGGDGNNIAKNGGTLPPYVTVTFSGAADWAWNWNTMDAAALQKNGAADRVASCWYAPAAFDIDLTFTDGLAHRFAIYCLDWDKLGRQQTITLSDPATGAALNTQTLANFTTGTWLVWDVKGKVRLNVKTLNARNTVISGLFFGLGAPDVVPVQQVAVPVISPPGGTFATAQTATITTATTGATIRYTLDGSTPTPSSAIYTAPISLPTAVTVNARAFKTGMTDSLLASATFNISNPSTPTGPLVDLGTMPNRIFPAPEGFDTVQFAPDGKLGFIVWKDQQLIYRERNTANAWSETVVTGGGNVFQMLAGFTYSGNREDYKFQPSAILLYDVQSQPHVLQVSGRNVAHFSKGAGGWALFETIVNPVITDNLAVLVGAIGPNNVIHLGALSSGGPRKLTYGTNKSGSWNWALISSVTDAALSYWAPPYAPRWLSLAADSRNFAHLTYRSSMDLSYDSANHPRAYSELKYASNASGQWASRLVQIPVDISAEAANGASIAIAPDDKPRIASWYNDRGEGGSSSESRLYYHEPDASGNWSGIIVLRNPDGYSGGDGPKGTGFSPYLRFDGSGRPHILFLDHAGEHFSNIGQQEYAGNLRHAWRNGAAWSFETIYRQVAPLDREIIYPAFAMRGSEMAVTLLQRDTRWNLSSFPPISNSTYYFRFFTKPIP